MPLNELSPGLRRLHNGSKDTVRAEVQVPPGDELEVSETVAGQLQATSGAFKDGPAPVVVEGDGGTVTVDPDIEDRDVPDRPSRKRRGR